MQWKPNKWVETFENLHLSGQHTEEDKDEHPLEGVGDGEQVRSEGGLVQDVQDPEGPGGPEHEEQSEGPAGTGPGGEGGGQHTDFNTAMPQRKSSNN